MHEWRHAAADLIANFRDQPIMLLDILVAFPEEITDRHLRIDANRRHDFERELAEDCPYVFQLCELLVQQSTDEAVQSKTLKCLAGFLRFAGPNGVQIGSSFLLPACFQALAIPQLADNACDVVCEAIFLSRRKDSEETLRPIIMAQIPVLRAQMQECIRAEDSDMGFIFASIFTDLGKSCIETIVEAPTPEKFAPAFAYCAGPKPSRSLQYVEDVLALSLHPDHEVVQRTFNFWYNLADVIDEAENVANGAQKVLPVFESLYLRLFQNLAILAQCPGDLKELLAEKTTLAEYRRKMANLLIDTTFIPTSRSVFDFLLTELWSQAAPLWQQIERTFFVLRALGRNLDPRDDKWGPQVMFYINSLPTVGTPLQLRFTVVELIAQMAQWLQRHPDHLGSVVQRLTEEIQVKELSQAAAEAVEELCAYCRISMAPHFEHLIQLVRFAEASGYPFHDVLKLYDVRAAPLPC